MPTTRRRTLNTEVQTIRRSLASVARALGRIGPALDAAVRASRGPQPARKLNLSPERMAALKLQGQYIGHIRTLAPREKEKVQAVREEKGIRAAIAQAKKLARAS